MSSATVLREMPTAPENIYSLVALSGRSLRELEIAGHFGRNGLSRVLSGRHPPRWSTVERLAGALGLDPETVATSLARARATYAARTRFRAVFARPRD